MKSNISASVFSLRGLKTESRKPREKTALDRIVFSPLTTIDIDAWQPVFFYSLAYD